MNFTSIKDIDNLSNWVDAALKMKNNPLKKKKPGKNKTLGMLFFNPSLRTRLSTQKAALNLGMNVMVMNFTGEGWTLEFEDGAIMNSTASEHIKEAAAVISQYCDVIAIRAFAGLTDKEKDNAETVLTGFLNYATVPIVNMESATGHPLQSLADAITLAEFKTPHKPKVVLSWAPHPKALPQAVANSFVEMMQLQDADFVITHPEGYELNPEITKNSKIEYDQDKAFENADFIYAKNWSNYNNYGQITNSDPNWTITSDKMKLTNHAKLMHCLPVRRNMIVTDEVLDGENSIVIEQANNRTYAAQLVLQKILKMGNKAVLNIVKIGGNIIDDPNELMQFLIHFANINGHKILVHGGGKSATKTAENLGLVPQLIEGRRVTDSQMLEVAVMVYAGQINKNIVAKLQANHCNAMGFSGADGNLILSEKRNHPTIDYGFVGDVEKVNTDLLEKLMSNDIIPVFSAITHDGNGQLLNTNADTIAGQLAIALSKSYKVTLIYCFEKQGVLANAEDENSVIENLNPALYSKLKSEKSVHSGMIPKLDNCFNSLQNGVHKIKVGHHNILQNSHLPYTTITL